MDKFNKGEVVKCIRDYRDKEIGDCFTKDKLYIVIAYYNCTQALELENDNGKKTPVSSTRFRKV